MIRYRASDTYFTAVLQVGNMFDGGGVPIDHYIIQVDNGTQLETAGPTYSFDYTVSEHLSSQLCRTKRQTNTHIQLC